MAMTTLSTTVDADNAGRVDLVIRQLSESSHSQVRGMVTHGCVSINGAPCKTIATSVAAGDLVSTVRNWLTHPLPVKAVHSQ